MLVTWLPLVAYRYYSKVNFFDSHLVRYQADFGELIKYVDIDSFSWQLGERFNILNLQLKYEDDIRIGVPLDRSQELISEFLESKLTQCHKKAEQRSMRRRLSIKRWGIFLVGIGLVFAMISVLVHYSDECIQKTKNQLAADFNEVENKLVLEQVPEKSLKGLLYVYGKVGRDNAVLMHFYPLTVFITVSLLIASVGFSLLLYGKLCDVTYYHDKEIKKLKDEIKAKGIDSEK